MLLAEAGCVFMGFILFISEVRGQGKSICALKGTSVDLSCSAENETSHRKWYSVHWDDHKYVLNETFADGHVTYNMSEQNNTLSIKDLRDSDAKFYCCRENTENPYLCYLHGTELHVTDLQVKVIPTTEEQTVSLMCSTSCPLTENPAAYIWYKNREFLYQDWSPWYQQLVSSEEAVTYSCAIKGYEHLRAPEVSVDSVTSSCFSVTYAKGRMCSYQEKSEDEPCSITYPTEVHALKTVEHNIIITCNSSCPEADSHTTYSWYYNKHLYSDCESQLITFTFYKSYGTVSCAVKGHEDLHADVVCSHDRKCWMDKYVNRRICALEGFSVNISSEYFHSSNETGEKFWFKKKRPGDDDPETLTKNSRVEYHDNMKNHHMLRINNLQKDDSAEYIFTNSFQWSLWNFDLPGVILVVTGLKVTMTPSAEVTEGQRVTLTCSTSCPLTDDTNYLWYLNSRPLTLPENQTKHLVLDPVSSQHAGKYSCAVKTHNISSSEKTLTVTSWRKSVAIMNSVKLILLLLILSAACLLYQCIRKKKSVTSTAEQSGRVQTGQDLPCESILFKAINPAAPREPAEQQEDIE